MAIKADDKSSTSVTVYTNNRIVPFGDKNDSSKIIILVPYNDTTSKIFDYGIGGRWSNDAIANLTTNIDSVVIKNTNNKVALVNKADIEDYLKKHRGGYAGCILTIKAK